MSEPVYTFRLATAADAEALQAIYAPYIETSITFECTCPDVEEFRKRIKERVCMYPFVVCEERRQAGRLRICKPPFHA